MKKRTFKKPAKVTRIMQFFNLIKVEIDLKRQKRKGGERNTSQTHENIIILSIIFVISILIIVYKLV